MISAFAANYQVDCILVHGPWVVDNPDKKKHASLVFADGADERVVYSDDPWNADRQRFHDHSRRGCGDGSVLVNVDNSFMNDVAGCDIASIVWPPRGRRPSARQEAVRAGSGKSDRTIVPMKEGNNGKRIKSKGKRLRYHIVVTSGLSGGKGEDQGNVQQGYRLRTQRRELLQQALERVRKVAVGDRTAQFTSIWHLVYDPERLFAAFLSIKRQSAAGIDGQTKQAYEERLFDNLLALSKRLRQGAYHAKPVKRVYIPKADGRELPIGIPALEDKIVQRAAAEVLGAIYETDFHDFYYGFRPGRSQHQALDTLAVGLRRRPLNWVLDADIRGFFDNIDHDWMLKFIKHRIADKRVWHHIHKWLQAGVSEDGEVCVAEYGTPQGGSISPLLANIYLHYAFDRWAHDWRCK
jgi:RNA-directed DNA polymerase